MERGERARGISIQGPERLISPAELAALLMSLRPRPPLLNAKLIAEDAVELQRPREGLSKEIAQQLPSLVQHGDLVLARTGPDQREILFAISYFIQPHQILHSLPLATLLSSQGPHRHPYFALQYLRNGKVALRHFKIDLDPQEPQLVQRIKLGHSLPVNAAQIYRLTSDSLDKKRGTVTLRPFSLKELENYSPPPTAEINRAKEIIRAIQQISSVELNEFPYGNILEETETPFGKISIARYLIYKRPQFVIKLQTVQSGGEEEIIFNSPSARPPFNYPWGEIVVSHYAKAGSPFTPQRKKLWQWTTYYGPDWLNGVGALKIFPNLNRSPFSFDKIPSVSLGFFPPSFGDGDQGRFALTEQIPYADLKIEVLQPPKNNIPDKNLSIEVFLRRGQRTLRRETISLPRLPFLFDYLQQALASI